MIKKILMLFILARATIVVMSCSNYEKPEEKAAEQGVETTAALPSGDLMYKVPDGWVSEEPNSRMRKAQFRLPGIEGEEAAELAVFFFPGMGGSVQANLDRWYSQFRNPDNSAITEGNIKTSKEVVGNLPVTTVYLTGTYLQPQSQSMMGAGPVTEMPDYALLAAIAETTNGPWFYKAVGPQKTIDHWRESFAKFVGSLRTES